MAQTMRRLHSVPTLLNSGEAGWTTRQYQAHQKATHAGLSFGYVAAICFIWSPWPMTEFGTLSRNRYCQRF